jgi:hypothetical protein
MNENRCVQLATIQRNAAGKALVADVKAKNLDASTVDLLRIVKARKAAEEVIPPPPPCQTPATSFSNWAGTGFNPATSAPGLRSRLPHLRWQWAQPCHICASWTQAWSCHRLRRDWALGPGPALPHLFRQSAHRFYHLHQHWAHP